MEVSVISSYAETHISIGILLKLTIQGRVQNKRLGYSWYVILGCLIFYPRMGMDVKIQGVS